MSTVVFCEGRHDVDFLSRLHKRFNGRNFDTFIDDECEDDQDTRVRQHKLDAHIEYLYKAEGGRPEVIKKFRSHATEFGDYELVLLVDFDKDGLSSFMGELHDKLAEHYGDSLRVNPSIKNENSHMEFYSCNLLINGGVEGEFDLMAFKDDLEAVTFIHGGDDRHQQLTKIDYYMDNCPGISRDVSDVLY